MPDGTESQPMTTDQQLDLHVGLAKIADAFSWLPGAARTAGGGGEGGYFAISSLDELDGFISRWRDILDDIDLAGSQIQFAMERAVPPAGDRPSGFEVEETITSLQAALDHNLAMRQYAQAYVKKLEAARQEYAGVEDANATTIDKSGA